jgi:hypothetical protein
MFSKYSYRSSADEKRLVVSCTATTPLLLVTGAMHKACEIELIKQ